MNILCKILAIALLCLTPLAPASAARARSRAERSETPWICNGSITFSSAESTGTRLKFWKTKPILRARNSVSALSDKPRVAWSPKCTSPAVGESISPMMFISVVLPLPDGPQTARNSPAWMSSETPCSASIVVSPKWKRRRTSHSRKIGACGREWFMFAFLFILELTD